MKAAVYTKTKSGKVLQIRDVETPIPKDSEVLIKVRAASVNPLDWRLKSRCPGVDVAGEVVGVGKRVTQFKAGDSVFGTCRGAFAEYACASEATLMLKPNDLTFEQAAGVPVAGLTALQGLRDKGNLQSGQKVLINGAAGGVGTFAVQIAKSLGAEVTGVCSSRNVEMVRSLGADQVIDYTEEDFTKNGRHYDLLLDNVGNRSLSSFKQVMTPGGRCVLVGAPKELWAVITGLLEAIARSALLRQKFALFIAKLKKDNLTALCELMKTGKVTTVIDRRYQLSDTADAIAYVEQGHARAKVVINFE
jgi:NADPH:quinone reductase-like Zn-dependent oxidoreductase